MSIRSLRARALGDYCQGRPSKYLGSVSIRAIRRGARTCARRVSTLAELGVRRTARTSRSHAIRQSAQLLTLQNRRLTCVLLLVRGPALLRSGNNARAAFWTQLPLLTLSRFGVRARRCLSRGWRPARSSLAQKSTHLGDVAFDALFLGFQADKCSVKQVLSEWHRGLLDNNI